MLIFYFNGYRIWVVDLMKNSSGGLICSTERLQQEVSLTSNECIS